MWVEGLGINGALGEGVEFMWGFEQGEKKKPSGAWNQYGENKESGDRSQ